MRAWCPASFAQSWRQLRIRRFDLVHFSVRAGQRFLVFSNLEGGFDAMMGSPLNAVLVTGEDDAVGDTEMVLASAALPVASQAHAMATALGAAGGPHGQVLGQYLAGLLAYGPERDALELAGVVESTAFSERGKGTLLSGLAHRLAADGQTNERILSVFASLVPRYFAGDSPALDDGLTATQKQVLFNYVPLIEHVEGLRARLRTGVPAPVTREFLAKLEAISKDPRVRPDGREHARELLTLIGRQ
jgi:hypothetical protein